MTKNELTTALRNLETTVEMKAGKWDREMFNYVLAQCACLDEAEFLGALTRCKAELRFPIVPADVLDRCPSLQVMSADEAWAAIGGTTEADTIVWTDLAAAAYGEVSRERDPTAQRMAFRAAYTRLADAWKTAGRRPKVQVSLGTDPNQRADALRLAVSEHRLPEHEAGRLLGLPKGSSLAQKALPYPSKKLSVVDLTDEDRIYLAEMMRPHAPTPTVCELRERLGPYADAKMQCFLGLFLAGGPTTKVFPSGCVGCGAQVQTEGEEATTRCPDCKTKRERRWAERIANAERQIQRERVNEQRATLQGVD